MANITCIFKIFNSIPENVNSLMLPVATILNKDVSKLHQEDREMSAGD